MEYQHGLKRQKGNPLDEFIKMQSARQTAEAQQKADAQTYANKNVQSQIYTKKVDGKDKYYKKQSDDAGGLEDVEITKLQYDQEDSHNQYINKQRGLAGLNQTDVAPQDLTEPKKPGIWDKTKGLFESASKFLKGDSGDPTPKKTTPVDLNKDTLNQANQSANTNVGGANIDIAKGVNGGGVKASLMDDKIGKTMPIPSKSTTTAYDNSLRDRENRAKEKASLIGKPPPNPARDRTLKPTSEAELTKVGQGIDERNRKADERSKDFSARKIGTGSITPQELRKQGGFMPGGYKKSYERAKQVEGMTPDQRRMAQYSSGRLKLPSKKAETNSAIKQIVAHKDSLQAQRKQKELSKPKYSQSLPQQPDMVDDVAIGKIKQQGTYLPDYGGALKVMPPAQKVIASKPKGDGGNYKGKLRESGMATKTHKRRVATLKSGLKSLGDVIAKPESKRKVVGGLTPVPQKTTTKKKSPLTPKAKARSLVSNKYKNPGSIGTATPPRR